MNPAGTPGSPIPHVDSRGIEPRSTAFQTVAIT